MLLNWIPAVPIENLAQMETFIHWNIDWFWFNFAMLKSKYVWEPVKLKHWLWLAAVACVVRWPISNALLNDIGSHALHECVIKTTDTNTVYCG